MWSLYDLHCLFKVIQGENNKKKVSCDATYIKKNSHKCIPLKCDIQPPFEVSRGFSATFELVALSDIYDLSLAAGFFHTVAIHSLCNAH